MPAPSRWIVARVDVTPVSAIYNSLSVAGTLSVFDEDNGPNYNVPIFDIYAVRRHGFIECRTRTVGFSSRRCLFADPSSVTKQPAVGTGEVIADIIEQFSIAG